ncbi:tyrosine-type recombinase/integrase [Pseudomonas indica]|uniref:tyrosine-type recombinase/integrase n=1 Tax=Pseudomonas indica TaxID=137658 RepID=UPI0023FA26DA|nr:tyrosine-type recombinase/integrase [Pseudomonas indica]MBU3054957.1 tyrosine-type recombinase/integrase [Pseudomonas indica]
MEISSNIQRALAYFHLGNPDATWEELKERLLAIAKECLEIAHGDIGSDLAHSEFYQEMYGALKEVSKQGDLSLAQHRALAIGQSIMAAANARLEGRPGALVKIIDKLHYRELIDSEINACQPLSVGTPQDPTSWDELSSLYMAEHSINLKESSRKAAITAHTVIGEAFAAIGVTDLRVHTRENMTALRAKLLDGRKASTVNNLLAKLQAVMTWAVRSDKITKQYADKLKITKGAESERVAFTREQVVILMTYANALPSSSWERWALSLLAVTGARVGEVSYLTKADIKQVDGLWCIDINEDAEGKSIKNKHSKRLVPLVDRALGFDLSAFLQAVDEGALPSDNRITTTQASKRLNQLIRDALGDSKGDNQSLHSLRHHLISAMQAAGVPVAFAQAAAGQSSGTIAYNVYGSGSPIQRVHEAIKQGLMEAPC